MGYVEMLIRETQEAKFVLQDKLKILNALLEARDCYVCVDKCAVDLIFEMNSDAKTFSDFCKDIPFTFDFARCADKIIQLRNNGKKKILKSRYAHRKNRK